MKLRGRRFQFSIASLLMAMVVLAVLLGAWDYFTFEPYSYRLPLYEKADGTFSDSIDIGPNTVSMGLVTRNDRDGKLHYGDGRGRAVANRKAQNEQALVDSAGWLDVVQIELAPTPDRVDIIEARIFGLPGNETISRIDPAYGWRVTGPDVVQIYGLGKQLPPKLDVWFRLHSYDKNDPVTKLAKTVGSSCTLPGGTLELLDVRDGYWGFTSDKGLVSLPGTAGGGTTLLMRWNGVEQDREFQIAAVSKTGRKSHTDMFHYLRLGPMDKRKPVHFDMELDEADHFELRPFGGRHRFFFGAVELPRTSGGAFGKPPVVNVHVGGREIDTIISEFEPLQVRLLAHRGEWADGVASGPELGHVMPKTSGATNVDSCFTLDYRVEKFGQPSFRWKRKSATPFEDESAFRPGGSTSTGSVGYRDFGTPLEEIEAVEVTLRPK